MEKDLKQVIVVRSDLRLGKGKLAGQVAHAAVSAADKSKWKKDWMAIGQKKSVLKCADLEELLSLYERAKRAGLPVELISDAGKTQIPAGTTTCVGIGPAPEELIDKFTGDLKLL
jgi:PTH2 family peptidyl-tRNA hydrolase